MLRWLLTILLGATMVGPLPAVLFRAPAPPAASLVARVLDERRMLERYRERLPAPVLASARELLAMPTSGMPLVPEPLAIRGSALERRLQRIEHEVREQWPALLDVKGLAPPGPGELLPLAERVQGWDALGMPVHNGWGTGYLWVTSDHLYLCMLSEPRLRQRVPLAEVSEFSPGELERLDSVDQQRYLQAMQALGRGRAAQATEAGRVQVLGDRYRLWSLIPPVERQVRLGLALLYLAAAPDIRQVTRYPWNVSELASAFLAESVFAYRPASRATYPERASDGYLVRCYVHDDLIALALARYPSIFLHGVPAQPPALLHAIKGWFSEGLSQEADSVPTRADHPGG